MYLRLTPSGASRPWRSFVPCLRAAGLDRGLRAASSPGSGRRAPTCGSRRRSADLRQATEADGLLSGAGPSVVRGGPDVSRRGARRRTTITGTSARRTTSSRDAAQEHPPDAGPAAAADDDDVRTLGRGRGQDGVGRLRLPTRGASPRGPTRPRDRRRRWCGRWRRPPPGRRGSASGALSAPPSLSSVGWPSGTTGQHQQPAARVVRQVERRLHRGIAVIAAIGGDQDRPEACHGLPLSPGRMSRRRMAHHPAISGRTRRDVVAAATDYHRGASARDARAADATAEPAEDRPDRARPAPDTSQAAAPGPAALVAGARPAADARRPPAATCVLGRRPALDRHPAADQRRRRLAAGGVRVPSRWTWRTSSPATSGPSWTPTTTTCSW